MKYITKNKKIIKLADSQDYWIHFTYCNKIYVKTFQNNVWFVMNLGQNK